MKPGKQPRQVVVVFMFHAYGTIVLYCSSCTYVILVVSSTSKIKKVVFSSAAIQNFLVEIVSRLILMYFEPEEIVEI